LKNLREVRANKETAVTRAKKAVTDYRTDAEAAVTKAKDAVAEHTKKDRAALESAEKAVADLLSTTQTKIDGALVEIEKIVDQLVPKDKQKKSSGDTGPDGSGKEKKGPGLASRFFAHKTVSGIIMIAAAGAMVTLLIHFFRDKDKDGQPTPAEEAITAADGSAADHAETVKGIGTDGAQNIATPSASPINLRVEGRETGLRNIHDSHNRKDYLPATNGTVSQAKRMYPDKSKMPENIKTLVEEIEALLATEVTSSNIVTLRQDITDKTSKLRELIRPDTTGPDKIDLNNYDFNP